MAKVHLNNVQKTYGSGAKAVAILHGLSIDIADGEFLVIIGPSGCGKSTLLRLVAGLEHVTAGDILIGERVVNDLEPMDRDIAMVFQNYALYPHMTVLQNMAYGLTIRGMSKEAITQRVNKAATILELGPLLQRMPRELSGGQRQRVAMGRAIVREPAVFLFDEPLSNLDAKLRVQMRLEIQQLHRTLGTTSLYVTHDQVEAMTLGQRIIVMNAGRAEQIGTPVEVYERPATAFVASFIGSPPMNLLRGRVSDDGLHFDLADGTPIKLPFAHTALAQRDVLLGIRPEQLIPGQAGLALSVELVEMLGADLLVHALAGRQRVVMRVATGADIHALQHMCAGFSAQSMHWFDAQTNLRIDATV